MAKVKISEFSANPANNTDIDGINIAENCPPSGINDAIRELMAQLKDFQAGTAGDSFNGPIGTTTAAAGAFTTLTTSSTVTLNGGTANAVCYLNGSKVLTTGSALTFDGTNFGIGGTASGAKLHVMSAGGVGAKIENTLNTGAATFTLKNTGGSFYFGQDSTGGYLGTDTASPIVAYINNSEGMRLTSTGLGIGTSSPGARLVAAAASPIVASRGTAYLYSTDSMGANLGGQLSLGGSYTGTTETIFGSIAGRKENGTNNDIGGYLQFSTTNVNVGNVERMRLDSSGNLLVGTTSGAFTGKVVTLQTTSASNVITAWNSATSGDNSLIGFFTDGGSGRGSISYNRTAGLVAYNTTSDYRAKDISGPLTNSGALIDSVPVYIGKMKGATQERPMFIAHETPAYAHTGEKDAVDADGNPVYQQMDASALVPVMWAEIKSLRQRLAAAGI